MTLHPDDQKIADSYLQSMLTYLHTRHNAPQHTRMITERELMKATGKNRMPDHVVSEFVEYFQSCGAIAVHHERQATIELTVDSKTRIP
jgi:hypothetical protein